MRNIFGEFKGISEREKLLTIGGIIAFPVDIIALVELFRRVFNFQQINPTGRPDAVDMQLPPILAPLWDNRILDALTLTLLLYSVAILLVLLYRRNMILTISEIKRTNDENTKAFQSKLISGLSKPVLKEHLLLSSLLASMLVNSIVLPLFVVWLRVFVIYGKPVLMTFSFAFSVVVSLFSYIFLVLRTGDYYFLDYSIPEQVWANIEESTRDLRKWFSDFHSIGATIVRLLTAVFVFVSWLVVSLFATFSLHRDRAMKALLMTSYVSFPTVLFLCKTMLDLSWFWALLVSLIINFVVIPCIWGFFIIAFMLTAHLFVYLFTPYKIAEKILKPNQRS